MPLTSVVSVSKKGVSSTLFLNPQCSQTLDLSRLIEVCSPKQCSEAIYLKSVKVRNLAHSKKLYSKTVH